MGTTISGNTAAVLIVIALFIVTLFGIPGAIILAAIVTAIFFWAKKVNKEDIQQLVIDALTKKRITNPDDAAMVHQLRKVNFSAGELLHAAHIISDSMYHALNSKKKEVAENNMATVQKQTELINSKRQEILDDQTMYLINKAAADTKKRFHTVIYINAARGHLDRAAKLKTNKGKKKHILLAEQEIKDGLMDPDSDAYELAEHNKLIEDALRSIS